jgi:hypothetical protein
MTTVTPQQILNHRTWSVAAGDPQCYWGDLTTFSGAHYFPISNRDPPCFCARCRNLYDETGEADAELVNSGHARARKSYASLFLPPSPPSEVTRTEENGGWTDLFPKRSGTEWHGGVPLHVTIPPLSATHFDAIPTSLPAPRHRDIMNETDDERMKNDLALLRMKYQRDLIEKMDSKRSVFLDNPDREEVLASIRAEEDVIWQKIEAVKLLLSDM